MKIWKRVRGVLPSWLLPRRGEETDLLPAELDALVDPEQGAEHLALAKKSLTDLLQDERVPASVRDALADDYAEVQRMLDKLENGHVHVAAFGRVSVGKSSVLNALLGEKRFVTSPLHGATRHAESSAWPEYRSGGVYLIDTPGINEVDGEEREALARGVATRSDLVMFIVDGDITETELNAMRLIRAEGRPILLVLNKADRYGGDDLEMLRQTLAERTRGLVSPENIVTAAAEPAARVYVTVDAGGGETEETRQPAPDVTRLKSRLWEILDAEGKTLAALNAGLFAGGLSDQVAERIVATRRLVADRLVRSYCVTKGVTVALNPIPVADLAAALFVDGAMIWHLSKIYDLPMTRQEASGLVRVIVTQLAALMGTVWAIHLLSAALKLGTAGISTVVTAVAQGAVAYYGTYVVGRVAQAYLQRGKSWGEGGPKATVREILDSVDRSSILAQAREDILAHLRRAGQAR